MATSGTYTWNLDIADIIEEAYENCDIELRTGYHLQTARRSLNLLLTEWVNEGINLWEMGQLTTALVSGTSSYTLDASYIDITDAVIRNSSNVDTPLTRLSMSDYMGISNKTTAGTPTQFCIERNATGGHTMYVWPVPNDNTHSVVSWAIRYPEDIDTTYTDNAAIPKRFVPALIAGLSYRLGKKNPEKVDLNKLQMLKMDYMELLEKAKMEDRERTSFFMTPVSY